MAGMNPEIKAQWVAALRSGEYKQGRHRLRDGDRFCCLGVLCNLHAQAHPKIAATQNSKDVYLGADLVLPEAVVRWARLRDANPDIRMEDVCSNLSEVNDEGGRFKTIANLIEAQL